MKTQIEVHPIQADILCALLFKKSLRFSELNKTKLTNDHFSFHVNKLVEDKLIEKTKEGKYRLTKNGKEFANRFDTQNKNVERQAKVGVLLVCVKRDKNGTRYLIQQRLKQPYYGYHGFMTGKIHWGETIYETAERELEEETGLSGKFTFVGIKHKMDYSKSGELLEDKFFYIFRVNKTKGKLIRRFEGGRNRWLTRKEILDLPNVFGGIEGSFEAINKKQLYFTEAKYTVESY